MPLRTVTLVVALLLLQSAAVYAQAPAPRTLSLLVLEGRIRLDGVADEPAWSMAHVAGDFVQQRPDAGRAATLPTEVRVLRDGNAIYVAARLHDTHADSIVARLARRDEYVESDWFYVYLDTFHDRRNAFGFGVNAAGVQRDVRLTDDTQEDGAWDAVWQAAVRHDTAGWSVEMRIPLSQLRYVSGGGTRTWGINFLRTVARSEEASTWAPSPQGTARFVSDFGTLNLASALPARRAFAVLPYLVTRTERAAGDAADPYRGRMVSALSGGADLIMGLGGGLTLSATINPDFGQVEADPSQLNLSAFESFFPERRPFFTEGSEIFDLTHPYFPKLFHSRRIGRAPQGGPPGDAAFQEPARNTPILSAAKVTGRTAGGWTIGFLDAVTGVQSLDFTRADRTSGTTTTEPGANYAVARAAKDFADGATAIGALITATHRDIDDAHLRSLHRSAWTGAIDGRHRMTDAGIEVAGSIVASRVRGDTLALQRTQRAPGRRFQRPDAKHVEYDPTRTSLSGLGANLRVRNLGSSAWRFDSELWARSPGLELGDIGFQFENGADSWGSWTNVTYRRLRPSGTFRRWSTGFSASMQATFGGEVRQRGGGLDFDAQFANLWSIFLHAGGNLPALSPEALRGGPALRTPATTYLYANVGSDSRKAIGAGLSGEISRSPGNNRASFHLEPSLSIRPSARTRVTLAASTSWRRDAAEWIDRGETAFVLGRIDQRVASFSTRIDHTFTPNLSLQIWAQPFLAAGRYGDFVTVANARAAHFEDRFSRIPSEHLRYDAGAQSYSVDGDGDDIAELTFSRPDFNIRELRSNMVLRWEYRPGSTAFLVWGQDRSGYGAEGAFRLADEISALTDAPSSHRLILKVSHRLGS